jgi:hypothetical protein
MALPTVSKTEKVRLDYTQPISFSIEIGFGNPGGTEWFIGNQRGTVNGDGTVQLQNPGELEFLTLHCITTVEDVNDQTDKTAVTYRVHNAGTTSTFPFTFELKDKSRFVMYMIDFNFL